MNAILDDRFHQPQTSVAGEAGKRQIICRPSRLRRIFRLAKNALISSTVNRSLPSFGAARPPPVVRMWSSAE